MLQVSTDLELQVGVGARVGACHVLVPGAEVVAALALFLFQKFQKFG